MELCSDILDSLGNGSEVRKLRYDNEWYYSVIDVFADLLQASNNDARNYYHVLKHRFSQSGEEVAPKVKKLKLKAADGKMRRTDCTNIEGVQILQKRLEINIRNRDGRINRRQDDEVLIFHPKVIEHLEHEGWQVRHHVRLRSGHVIDIVGYHVDKVYIVECKPNLKKSLYTTIGQVLCYRAEFNESGIPVIACYSTKKNRYARRCCEALGIQIIEINR